MCDIPFDDTGIRSTNVGGSGHTEQAALDSLVKDNNGYQIKVGIKTSEIPRLEESVW